MKMTSAYANKLIRQLSDEKEYWVNVETSSNTYTVALDEEPVIPEYNFAEVNQTIAECDRKIRILKHAINLANVHAQIQVDDAVYSVDEILVKMSQLNRRLYFFNNLRKMQPQTRLVTSAYTNRSMKPEYRYINFDLEAAKEAYEQTNTEIMNLQMALDKYNQTFEFEVEL